MNGDAASGRVLPLRWRNVNEDVERGLTDLARGFVVFIKYSWPGIVGIGAASAVAREETFFGMPLVTTTWVWLGLCFVSLCYIVVARAGQSWFWPRTMSMAVNGLAFASLIWYGPDTLM